jgi:alpha-tubulin suppressor-like RCC1 family protein
MRILLAVAAAFLLALPGAAVADTISGGNTLSCSVSAAGAAECWGSNASSGLGNGPTPGLSFDPVPVSGLSSGVTDISAGVSGGCAVQSGAAKCWGYGNGTQGNGTDDPKVDTPVQVSGMESGVTKVSRVGSHTCAIKSGAAFCWGSNGSGRIGNGSGQQDGKDGSGATLKQAYNTPQPVTGMGGGATDIAAGWRHTCAIQTGKVYCWAGAVGYGPNSQVPGCVFNYDASLAWAPNRSVCGLPAVEAKRVVSGTDVSCALLVNGSVWCWGSGTYGVLGRPGTDNGTVDAAQVTGLDSGVADIALSSSHVCALMATGTVKCWGLNQNGQLGNGTARNVSSVPTDVVGLTGVTAIGTGDNHTCAIAGGRRYCWGSGSNGQGTLGNEADGAGESYVPVPVIGSKPKTPAAPAPTPQKPVVVPKPLPTASFLASSATRKIDAKRRATVATVGCPAGGAACAVTVPKKVTLKIGKKRYTIAVTAPKTIAAGKRATIRVALTSAAAKRLKGRTGSASVKITVKAPGGTTKRTVGFKVKR